MVYDHTAEKIRRLEHILVEQIGWKAADEATSWFVDYGNEIAHVSLRLAYALAHVDMGTSFETWLQKAVQLAGLEDHKPDLPLDLDRLKTKGTPIASAGAVAELRITEQGTCLAIPLQFALPEGNLFACRIRGDCMEASGIQDSDYIIVNRGGSWSDGDVVASHFGSELMCKRAYRLFGTRVLLMPDSPNYNPLLVNVADVVGPVLWIERSGMLVKPLPGPSRADIRHLLSY